MGKAKKEINDLNEFLAKLREEERPIIVEGKKDKAALRKCGVSNVFVLYHAPIYKIVESIVKRGEGCIILTDLDKKGKQIYGKLNRELQQFGVNIDNSYRNFLFKKTKLRQIEGLYNYCIRGGIEFED